MDSEIGIALIVSNHFVSTEAVRGAVRLRFLGYQLQVVEHYASSHTLGHFAVQYPQPRLERPFNHT